MDFITGFIGSIAALLSVVSMYFSIKHAIFSNYDKSTDNEKSCALWLIVALLCFK